jgi:signal transduction histidine kinase
MLRRAAILLLAACAGLGDAGADGPALQQLHHTVWTINDGLPDHVSVISQGADGLLWLGTTAGLYRFDGVRFEKFEPAGVVFPDQDVYALGAAPDGSMWVGWRIRGISRIKDGQVTSYGAQGGIHNGSTWGFAFEPNGHVWAAGVSGLSRFDGKQWEAIGKEHGYGGSMAHIVFVDKAATLAVFGPQGLFLKGKSEQHFRGPVGKSDAVQPPLQASDGRLFLMDENKGIRGIDSLERYERHGYPWVARFPDQANGSMLLASDNTLWFDAHRTLYRQENAFAADAGTGVAAASAQSINHLQGLSGESTYAIFEDRERNVWVATDKGLDRFRRASVLPVAVKPAMLRTQMSSVLANPDGGVLVFTTARDGGIVEIGSDGSQHLLARGGYAALAHARDGSLWTARSHAIERRDRKGALITSWQLPPALAATGFIRDVAEGPDGGLWVALVRNGVRRFRDGQWSEPVAGLYRGGQATPLSMSATPSGKILFGYVGSHAAIVDGERIQLFGPDEGLTVRQVAHMAEAQNAIWAAGGGGAALLDRGRFRRVTLADGRDVPTSNDFVAAPDGSLWFNTTEGLLAISATEVTATIASASHRPRYRIFNRLDGAAGTVGVIHQHTAVVDRQGLLWFTTTAGLFRTDPKQAVSYPYAAAPLITQAKLGDRPIARPGALSLSPSERDLQIEFTSPILSIPERVAFRYRLLGYQDDWKETGTRRQAFFTGLPQGRYRFEVAATNADGVWGEPLGLPVTVAPRFYQTYWFRAALALFTFAVLLLLYRLRIRQVERRVHSTMAIAQAERDRIARELHDTLLQGVQGLILKLHALMMKAPGGTIPADHLAPILDRADAMLTEGREKVHNLRAPDLLRRGLGPALQYCGDELSMQTGLEFCLTVRGDRRTLHPDCEYDVYRIGAEALSNAFRHSGGTRVTLVLAYEAAGLVLTVADNGRGIPDEILRHGRTAHYGLAGMRERSELAGGTLDIAGGEGATIRLKIPAARAYGRPR